MSLDLKRKMLTLGSLCFFVLFWTQIYQIFRHVQIIPNSPQELEIIELDIKTSHMNPIEFQFTIDNDIRKKKSAYPIKWFNVVSRSLYNPDIKKYNFLSITFISINLTYPVYFLIFHGIEILFTLLLYFYCFFNLKHYQSDSFKNTMTVRSNLNLSTKHNFHFPLLSNQFEKTLGCITSPSLQSIQSRKNERWYLFKDERKLGPYSIDQVEYLAKEKTSINNLLCMSTHDHRVYQVKNIVTKNEKKTS